MNSFVCFLFLFVVFAFIFVCLFVCCVRHFLFLMYCSIASHFYVTFFQNWIVIVASSSCCQTNCCQSTRCQDHQSCCVGHAPSRLHFVDRCRRAGRFCCGERQNSRRAGCGGDGERRSGLASERKARSCVRPWPLDSCRRAEHLHSSRRGRHRARQRNR